MYPSVRGRHSVDGEKGEKMKSTIKRLKYFDKKKLALNVGNKKVIRFRREGRKMRKTELK